MLTRRTTRFTQIVCGVDEAGRGPLAGPVVAAAVILDRARPIDGIDDSKALDAAARETLYAEITAGAAVSTAVACVRRIDRHNIREATLWAMARAVSGLPVRPTVALVDGRDVPPALCVPGRALVRGDARSQSIAAASIVAKVIRDRLMVRLAAAYPAYGFERHKGYPTAQHRAAIEAHGPCPHHRHSFAPVRAAAARWIPLAAE